MNPYLEIHSDIFVNDVFYGLAFVDLGYIIISARHNLPQLSLYPTEFFLGFCSVIDFVVIAFGCYRCLFECIERRQLLNTIHYFIILPINFFRHSLKLANSSHMAIKLVIYVKCGLRSLNYLLLLICTAMHHITLSHCSLWSHLLHFWRLRISNLGILRRFFLW